MRILYGVQGTGHGHLVRSAAMVAGLRNRGHDVHCLLTGRSSAAFADSRDPRQPHSARGVHGPGGRRAGEVAPDRPAVARGSLPARCPQLRRFRVRSRADGLRAGFGLDRSTLPTAQHRRRSPVRIPPAPETAGADRAGHVDAAPVRSGLHAGSDRRGSALAPIRRHEPAADDQSRSRCGGCRRFRAGRWPTVPRLPARGERTEHRGSSGTPAEAAVRRLPARARAGRARQRIDSPV